MMRNVDFEPVSHIESELMHNPYTIHQAFSFMEASPLLKIFSLVDGEVTINDETARAFTERERLYPTAFDIDNLAIWSRALSAEEVLYSYSAYIEPAVVELEKSSPRSRRELGTSFTAVSTSTWTSTVGIRDGRSRRYSIGRTSMW